MSIAVSGDDGENPNRRDEWTGAHRECGPVWSIYWAELKTLDLNAFAMIDLRPFQPVDECRSTPDTTDFVRIERVNRRQKAVIEYLRTENQVLKEKLGKRRIILDDNQRRRLAEPVLVSLEGPFRRSSSRLVRVFSRSENARLVKKLERG